MVLEDFYITSTALPLRGSVVVSYMPRKGCHLMDRHDHDDFTREYGALR
jgi:hypothetical protein